MNSFRAMFFVILAVPVVLSVLFMVADCQGDWFDNPESATCNLYGIQINQQSVMFFYFMGPLTLISSLFLWGVVYIVKKCKEQWGRNE